MANFYLIILSFSISVVILSSASPSLVLNLIHTNQIYSLKPPSVSRIEEASFTRLDYLQAKETGDIFAHISAISTAFLVNISIGSPPMKQLLHIDTGSDLSWLQCLPCTHCFPQSLPIFDPSRSYTYESCTSTTESCEYSIEYMDGTMTSGILARDTLTFDTIYDESSTASLPRAVFGCGNDNNGGSIIGTGVFGLGYGEDSLVHRFGSKFSYCFGSLFDPTYPHNVLVLGDDSAKILGDTTSLEIENDIYYVRMEAISVDGTILPIDPWVFQRNHQTRSGGTIIDTGTTLTHLVREAYEPLKSKIEDTFNRRFETAYQYEKSHMQCYKGDFERDLVESGFPVITFHFSDGAELSLDVKSVFLKDTPDVFCLAVIPNTLRNVIGAMTQQSYNIGYDLEGKKVSFERIDCGVLFDY